MNLLHLQYFCAIAQEESISRAAEKMNIAQSALSKALSSLEEDLGVRLFDRVGKYIRLNEDGRLLYRQCSYALALIGNAEQRIRNRNERQEGEVIVCAETLSPYQPEIIRRFHGLYPRIRLQLAQAYDAMELRAKGAYDVSISDYYDEEQETLGAVLVRDEFVLFLPKNHPLAQAGEVDLAQMRSETFIYCCRVGDQLNEAYDALCRLAGFKPHVFLNGADLSVTVAATGGGNAVAIVPASAIATLPANLRDAVAMVKIRTPHYANPIHVVTPRGKVASAAAELFIGFVQDYFGNLYPGGVCSLDSGRELAGRLRDMATDDPVRLPDLATEQER